MENNFEVLNNKEILSAIKYAKEKHKNQVREDLSPYINHPIYVAKLVSMYFNDHENIKDLIICAYLHDTIEDSDATYQEINNLFGDDVASLVLELTNNEKLKRLMGKVNYLSNKLVYMSEDALNIKLCDRLSNVIDLVNASPSFRKKYMYETKCIINYLEKNRKLSDEQLFLVQEIKIKLKNLIENNNIKKLTNY